MSNQQTNPYTNYSKAQTKCYQTICGTLAKTKPQCKTKQIIQPRQLITNELSLCGRTQGLKPLSHLRYCQFIRLQYLFFSRKGIPFFVDNEYFSWWTMNTTLYRQGFLLLFNKV